MKIENLVVGEIEANCYLVFDDEKNCLIIDLGGDLPTVKSYIKAKKLNVVGILLTHGHADHIACSGGFNVPVYVHELEKEFLTDDNLNCASLLGYSIEKIDEVKTFCEGSLNVSGFDVTVLHTPGHTRGSCSFVIGDVVFTGDTIMQGCFGRTDLPTGSSEDLQNSITKLLTSFDDKVYMLPGHGEPTTIGEEKRFYPFIDNAKN